MDKNELITALQYVNGKTQDEIRMAETAIAKARTIEGFIPNLMIISCDESLGEVVKHTATIILQSEVKTFWRKRESHDHEITEKDREILKENVVEALFKTVGMKKLYKQYEQTVKHVGRYDFPKKWTSILPFLIEKLKNSSKYEEIFGSLLALKSLLSNYQYLVQDERKQLDDLIPVLFPIFENFVKDFLQHYNEQSANALHLVLKNFHIATYLVLPAYLRDEKNLAFWMSSLKEILEKDLPQDLISPTEDWMTLQQRSKNIFWLNKKAAGKIIHNFFIRYGDKNTERSYNKGMAEKFLNEYAVPFLRTFVQLLRAQRQYYVHVKVYFFALKYISRALKYPQLDQLLNEEMESIMFENLLPAMFLTQDDQEDWNENPVEFIRKEDDANDSTGNIKVVASDLWERIFEQRIQASDGMLLLIKFMNYAADVLTNQKDPRTNQPTDLRVKEAILHIIGTVQTSILRDQHICAHMESILQKYVIPDFQNEIGFLRARACWLFGLFGKLDYQNKKNINDAITGIYKCINDKELPVKVRAAIALNQLMESEEALDMLRPGLGEVLTNYLQIINLIDKDELVYSLEGIIRKFGEIIHPYAYQLIEHLSGVFFKTISDDIDNYDSVNSEDEEKQFAAGSCLDAIRTIAAADLPAQTLRESEQLLIPIIDFTLTEKGCDFIEEGLRILVTVLAESDTISEQMWGFFNKLNYLVSGQPQALIQINQDVSQLSEEKQELYRLALEGWGYEFINHMVPAFCLYIKRGENVLFQAKDQYFNITYIELLFKSIDRIFQVCYNGVGDVDMVIASTLYVAIIENFPGKIDDVVRYILQKVIDNVGKARSPDMRKMYLQIILQAVWYNADLTFQFLEQAKMTQAVFSALIEIMPLFRYEYEIKRVLLGISAILRCNFSQIPSIVVQSIPGFLKMMINLTTKTLELREVDEDFDDEEEEIQSDKQYKEALNKLAEQNSEAVQAHQYYSSDAYYVRHNRRNVLYANDNEFYAPPLDNVCEILYLKDSLEFMVKNYPQAYQELTQQIENQAFEVLKQNIQTAEIQEQESNNSHSL